MNKEVLVVEISGKRPGDKKVRPTEKNIINYDKVIISNNSENYITDWPIINVPPIIFSGTRTTLRTVKMPGMLQWIEATQ